MAKFCSKCGKKLADGEKCTCSTVKEEKVVETSNKGCFSDILPILKGIIFKPVSTVKEYSTENNLVIALILMGVCALFGGLCYGLMQTGTTARLFGGYSSLVNYYTGVSFIGSFFKAFIFVIIYYGVLLGMILLMAKVVFKSKIKFVRLVTSFGIGSLYVAAGLVLGTIFAAFLPGLSTRIFALVGIFGLVQIIAVAESLYDITKDQVLYVMAPTFVAEFIVFFEIFTRI